MFVFNYERVVYVWKLGNGNFILKMQLSSKGGPFPCRASDLSPRSRCLLQGVTPSHGLRAPLFTAFAHSTSTYFLAWLVWALAFVSAVVGSCCPPETSESSKRRKWERQSISIKYMKDTTETKGTKNCALCNLHIAPVMEEEGFKWCGTWVKGMFILTTGGTHFKTFL